MLYFIAQLVRLSTERYSIALLAKKLYSVNPFRCSYFLKSCNSGRFLNNTDTVLCEKTNGQFKKDRVHKTGLCKKG